MLALALTNNYQGAMMMVEANPKFYKERMREARAEARAKRLAEQAALRAQREWIGRICLAARKAVIADIRARGNKPSHYKVAEIELAARAR
jgi:hypothetical protein